MPSPSVTVVVPTRNRARLLMETLSSVLAQEAASLHVVVVDEASSDGTQEQLERLGDSRVSIVKHSSPQGLSAARNAGLAVAESRWVAFVDDDDLWAPDKVASQLQVLAEHPHSAWCAVSAIHVDGLLRPLGAHRVPPGDDLVRRLLRGNVIPGGGSGVLARTEVLRRAGGFRTDLRAVEDWECWIRLAQVSPLTTVDLPLVAYRVWQRSMSRDTARMEEAESRVRALHAGLAQGLNADMEQDQLYLARLEMRNGERLRPASRLLRFARRHRSPRTGARALGAVVAPGATYAAGARRWRSDLDPEWAVRLDQWLQPYRDRQTR